MGLLDTFSRKFGFTTEEDDENEMEQEDSEIDEDEEEEDEEEDSGFSFRFPANPFKKRAQQPRRRIYTQDEDEEDEEVRPAPSARTPRSSNVIRDPRMTNQAQQTEPAYTHCERIVSVRQIEECREIIKCLLSGESVLLNLENIDPKDCGRVVDLLSGAAFALQGRMVKVAHLSYLLAPENVKVIEGDVYANPQARYR